MRRYQSPEEVLKNLPRYRYPMRRLKRVLVRCQNKRQYAVLWRRK